MDVSVIIPYNKDRGWLKECIKSVEEQEFTGTWEVLPEFGDATVGVHMNNGFRKAKGKYIKKLDEDDLLPPDSLQILFDFAEHGAYDWVWANALCFDGEHEWVHQSKSWFTINSLINRNTIHGGTGLYHRRTFEETGGWDENLWTAEEYDWHLLLTHMNFSRGYIPKVVYKQRMHNGSKYLKFVREKERERLELRNIIRARYEL